MIRSESFFFLFESHVRNHFHEPDENDYELHVSPLIPKRRGLHVSGFFLITAPSLRLNFLQFTPFFKENSVWLSERRKLIFGP